MQDALRPLCTELLTAIQRFAGEGTPLHRAISIEFAIRVATDMSNAELHAHYLGLSCAEDEPYRIGVLTEIADRGIYFCLWRGSLAVH